VVVDFQSQGNFAKKCNEISIFHIKKGRSNIISIRWSRRLLSKRQGIAARETTEDVVEKRIWILMFVANIYLFDANIHEY
jgi:hypothetical protein